MLWRCHADTLINGLSNSFFHFKQFSILSQEKGLKVNTDACLLGAIASHPKPEFCLDIGTGTGVIAMFLAQRFPDCKVEAIEIEEAVKEQAELNINSSKFKDRINVIHADFLKWKSTSKFDLIVSNPPYFSNHLKKELSEKNTAIHNQTLDFQLMIEQVKSMMHEESHFYLILPPFEMNSFIDHSRRMNLQPKEIVSIYNIPGKLFRIIACFTLKEMFEMEFSTLTIKKSDGTNSFEFSRLMQDFYLEDTQKFRTSRKERK